GGRVHAGVPLRSGAGRIPTTRRCTGAGERGTGRSSDRKLSYQLVGTVPPCPIADKALPSGPIRARRDQRRPETEPRRRPRRIRRPSPPEPPPRCHFLPARPGAPPSHEGDSVREPGKNIVQRPVSDRREPAMAKDQLPDIDTSVPQSARIWDYWLGGKEIFPAD